MNEKAQQRQLDTKYRTERERAKTDKEAFKYIKVQEKFENFQQVQNSYQKLTTTLRTF